MGRNILVGVTLFVVIGMFFSYFGFFAQCAAETAFASTDRFDIPFNNSSISFAFAGTYEQARLENGEWSFVNLRFNNSRSPEKLSFKVSAKDSIVNITSFVIYNGTFAGERAKGAFFRYTVVGQGTQAFDLGLDAERGDWSVIRNGDWLGENQGWSISPDRRLVVNEATGNVILMYYGFPGSFGESLDGFNQPFFNQHSIIICTTIVVVIIVLLAVTIGIRRKEKIS